jgi:hypothetical protein
LDSLAMMPVPTHLKECIVPAESKVDESPLAGKVRCPCGGETFDLLFPGQTHEWGKENIPCTAEIDGRFFFLIRAVCKKCGKSHLLLDTDFHGWNGFVCHDAAQAACPRPPLAVWKCVKCGRPEHTANIVVAGEGKQDFASETDGEIDEDRWPDGFGWLTIKINCVGCGHTPKTWVSCETM